jgi:hypothetical protein
MCNIYLNDKHKVIMDYTKLTATSQAWQPMQSI